MRISNDRILRRPDTAGEIFFWNIYQQTIRQAEIKSKRESFFGLLNDLGICIPVFAGKQKLRSHVQGTLRADIIALGAENALGDIDADTLC